MIGVELAKLFRHGGPAEHLPPERRRLEGDAGSDRVAGAGSDPAAGAGGSVDRSGGSNRVAGGAA